MASTFTTNIGIEQPATGDYPNAWAAPVNSDWALIDQALGSSTSVVFTNTNVTLTVAQSAYFRVICTGALSGDVELIFPAAIGGRRVIDNQTTGGHTLKVLNGPSDPGTGVTVAQGKRTPIILTTGQAYFDGADASALTGTTLPAAVTGSSLTSVGTLASGAIGSGFTPIGNSALANSSVTIAGHLVALGGSQAIAYSDLSAGAPLATTSAAGLVTKTAAAVLAEHQTSGTAGTGVPGAATTVCVINTTVSDPSSIISSLGSNQFTLAAGTYLVQFSVPFATSSTGGNYQAILYDVTNSATVGIGQSNVTFAVATVDFSAGSAVVTPAGATAYELKLLNSAAGTIGLAASLGTEVYSQVSIMKLP